MQPTKHSRIIANWIFLGIAMLVVQVLLGGITRLTGSGLSITEWKPIMGALPPTTESEWLAAFGKYRQIAQYKYLNSAFTLSDFKFIFFWEWFHRVWARLIGVAFLLPFVYFLIKKYIEKWMITPLVVLFILGALQGAVGWLMVKSGLNENDLYVSHFRLAAHFIAAMILLAYALIFGLKLTTGSASLVRNRSLRYGAIGIMALLILQLTYGAFMAGLKAAAVASTWPTINGEWLPFDVFSREGLISNLVHDKIAVHFVHRTLAYVIAAGIIVWWWHARRVASSKAFNRVKNLLPVLVILQVVLGVLSVLYSPGIVQGKFGAFEWLAQLHQLTGMFLFLDLTAVLFFLRQDRSLLVNYHKKKQTLYSRRVNTH